ncbi:MAG: hypothetical protein ACRDTU_16405 [Micromonosporaceae bacterium]
MGAGELLRQLDRRVLPPIGRVLAWSLRGAIRRRLVIGVGVLGSTALLAASVWAAHEPPTSPEGVGHVVRVGVANGQSVESYESAAGRELEKLTDGDGASQSYALVSFAAYLAPGRFVAALRGAATYRGYARVPLPNHTTNVAEITIQGKLGDLRAEMAKVADQKAAEAGSYQRDADKLTGSSDVERDRRERYRARADVADAEAKAYRSGCSCLFAAVVRASPSVLGRLANTPGVRTVDPAPEVTTLKRAIFMPPLPESPDNPVPAPATSSLSPSPSESHSGSSMPSSPAGSGSPSPDGSASTGSSLPKARGAG